MKKYVFMYNLDENFCEPEIFKNKLNKAGIDFYVEDSNIIPDIKSWNFKNDEFPRKKVNEGQSLWVLEDHYLIAITILNCDSLLGINWLDDSEGLDVQYCLDWFNRHKNDKLCIKEK